MDFSVRKWADPDHTIPVSLTSYCHTCEARRSRGPDVPPRDWGVKAKTDQQYRKELWERIKADPERHALVREYRRIWDQTKRQREADLKALNGVEPPREVKARRSGPPIGVIKSL